MKVCVSILSATICLSLGFAFPSPAQQTLASTTSTQNGEAIQELRLMASALISAMQNDIELSGTMQIESGGRAETATITAAARGNAETYEVIAGEYTNSTLVFANGEAAADGKSASLELACTAQSPLIPSSLIYALESDPNTGGEVIGPEIIDGMSLLHVRTWTNFSGASELSQFSQRDWWIDAASGVLHRLEFERRTAGGAIAGIEYQYDFLSFQNIHGLLVPSTIRESVNGTYYATITITSAQTNVGLTDQNFPVR